MTKIELKFIHRYKNCRGKEVIYFRRRGQKRIRLPGPVGSPAFMKAYNAALAGDGEKQPSVKAPPSGSLSALCEAYYRSADFTRLSESTKATYSGIIENFRAKHGHKPVAKLEARHVRGFIDDKSDTPAAANNLLRMLKLLMRHALERDWIKVDPTQAVRPVRNRTDGFATWSEDDIARYEAFHPVGTRERLAFALLLYTGARRSDVVKLGWQHIQGDRLVFRQQKTGGRVSIPIHKELSAILTTAPRDRLAFLSTRYGKPFTPESFGNWFRDTCKGAGLSDELSAHGLRKAVARRLAEAGCTPHEIASVTGHSTLKEVERYTKEANRDQLAEAAIASIGTKRGTPNG